MPQNDKTIEINILPTLVSFTYRAGGAELGSTDLEVAYGMVLSVELLLEFALVRYEGLALLFVPLEVGLGEG